MTVGVLSPEPGTGTDATALVRTRPPLWRELGLGLATFAVYSVVQGLSGPGRSAAAQRNGEQLLGFERTLHIDFETPLNAWLSHYPTLRVAANYEYAITYIVSAFWLLGWLYVRRPEVYRWARNSFILLNLIAMTCFVLYALAPPRLLAGESFFDTVRTDHTWGSWGSPLVSHANQLAAMPSLHIGWAMWVSVVLACVSGARWVQGASALHVTLTLFVILATANHYFVDALGAVVLIWLTLAIMSIFQDRPGRGARPRVASADAFFLHAESPGWPQHVGGIVILDDDGPVEDYRDRLRAVVEKTLPQLPRFTQQLYWRSRWRRPRWTEAEEIDWDWHLAISDLSRPDGSPGGYGAFWRHIANLQSELFPRDRPLWRFSIATGFVEGKVAAILLVHHSVADGIGTVAQSSLFFDPVPSALFPSTQPPSALTRAGGVVVGLAQLATDGRVRGDLPNSDRA